MPCPLEIGQQYAYRESRTCYGAPVTPVEVIKIEPRIKGRVRVVHLEGDYSGLKEWLPKKRLFLGPEPAYCQFLASVSEIPAAFEYIDFEGPPNRLRITKTGGISLSHGGHLCVPQHATGSISGSIPGPIPRPARRSVPGPGAIPTASDESIHTALSLDRHFAQEGFAVVPVPEKRLHEPLQAYLTAPTSAGDEN